VRNRIAVVCVTLAALSTLTAVAGAQATDPWIGTWKANLEKSSWSPGPAPKVGPTVTIERAGEGMKTTIDSTDPQGAPMHTETTWAFDGKDHPVKGGPDGATVVYKRINDRTFEVTQKIGGKPLVTTHVAVSADGKTMTATQTGTNPEGAKVNNVIVAMKQ
jgi:hypothetical protein